MPGLLILNASAGSGKTFNLVAEYLMLALAKPDNFKHILAVTFTNKATAEMKARIVDELGILASGNKSKYEIIIREKLGLSTETLKKNAGETLNALLHHYSQFSVSTIDRFFQGVMHSFSFELGLYSNLELELDHTPILNYAVNQLLADCSHNPFIARWMLQLAEQLIEGEKSWKTESYLMSLGQELFKEIFYFITEESKKEISSPDNLETSYLALKKIVKTYEDELVQLGNQGIKTIKDNGLSIDDFKNKDKGPANHFYKAGKKNFEFTTRTIHALSDPEEWFAKSNPKKQQIENLALSELMPLLNKMYEYQIGSEKQYLTAQAMLETFPVYAIMSWLAQYVQEYKKENRVHLLSETPRLLHTLFKNHAWFVFEKTGLFYKHLMIDEFQDTSRLQWMNFKPLFEENLSHLPENGNQPNLNLVVGDEKQAIYRWRNGDWEILGSEIKKDFEAFEETRELNTNYRSLTNIVEFNNKLFQFLPDFLSQRLQLVNSYETGKIKQAYRSVTQLAHRDTEAEKGYVEVREIAENEVEKMPFRDSSMNRVLEIIKNLIKQGYHQKDIAILVRKRDEASLIAGFLLRQNQNPEENGFPINIISDEALQLVNCPAVRLLVNAIKHLVYPKDKLLLFELEWEFATIANIPGQDWIDNRQTIPVLPLSFSENQAMLRNMPLYPLAIKLIEIFQLYSNPGFIPFLAAFSDILLKRSVSGASDCFTFLNWWKENVTKNSIAMPEEMDAIRILTIHKSKGLQFKVVILPFADWELEDQRKKNYLWVNAAYLSMADTILDEGQKESVRLLGSYPVKYGSKLGLSFFRNQYLEEKTLNYIDNLNLLYVAFTRAEETMYIHIPEGKNIHNKENSTAELIRAGILEFEKTKEPFTCFKMGSELVKPSENNENRQDTALSVRCKSIAEENLSFRSQKPKPEMDESTLKEAGSLGTAMHRVLEHIHTPTDLKKALLVAAHEGLLRYENIPELEREFLLRFQNPIVAGWFDKSREHRNEQSILLPNGQVYRPDRVLLKQGQCTVVDFKFTASREKKHHDQVKNYMGILQQMGYSNIFGYIWYVIENQIEECKI